MTERLQKYLAAAGVASRRKAEEIIKAGKVTINGAVATLGEVVRVGDVVEVEGRSVSHQPKVYLMLHKPAGYTTTVEDVHAEHTVMELIPDISARVFPVGRLDKDSEGLLLLTNDGELTNMLLHPSQHVDKTYLVTVLGKLSPQDVEALESGVELDDGLTAPAVVGKVECKGPSTVFSLTIYEGRKRQVRRMCAALGRKVLFLKRLAIGELNLGSLPRGECRALTEEEIAQLYKSARKNEVEREMKL